ncbi:MAG: zonular occludens toxin domain-containing protein [Desulfuromonadaceae bacterium]|nr:zonular occludens toxin domain-containing protein [Desulfuromonadaceae bacterium]
MISPIERGKLALWRWREGEFWFLRRSHKTMDLTLYAGLPGSSKTLWGVRDAVQLLRAGENVYSNLYIRDRLTGREALPCRSWLDMMRISVDALEAGESAWFFWDELHLWADARAWALTPPFLLTLFAERRHYRIGLLATTQHVDQVEKRLRTLVDRIVQVRPTGLRRFVRAWFKRELPLFWGEELDGAVVDAVAQGTASREDAVLVRGLKWAPWYVWNSYSTHEIVLGEDLTVYKDKEIQAEIAELERRAALCMEPDEIEAYEDRVSLDPFGVASSDPAAWDVGEP